VETVGGWGRAAALRVGRRGPAGQAELMHD
jgi:hypothetical protein